MLRASRRAWLARASVAIVLVGVAVVLDARPAGADIPGADLVSGLGGWAFEQVASGIGRWILGAVATFVTGVVEFLTTSARPDVTAGWFTGPGSPHATVRALSVGLAVAFTLLGIISGVVRGDGGGMARRVLVGIPAVAGGTAATTVVVGRLLELTDALSAAILGPSSGPAVEFLTGFGAKAAIGASTGRPEFAIVVVGLVAVLAAASIWAELLLRSALIYLLVALSPLVFAAALWPATRGMLRRTAELLLAVIASKLVVCIAIAVGVAALGGAGSAGGAGVSGAAASTGTLLVGASILVLAAFAPFLLLRLLPAVEAVVIAHGMSRAPARMASGAATSTTSLVTRLAGGAAAAPSAATSAAPAAASRPVAPNAAPATP